jgi:glycosyltransferase involved in cell wall biosynthesis
LVEGLSGAAIGGCRRVVHSEHGKEIEDTTPQPLRRKIAKKMCFVFAKKVVTVSRSLKEEFESNKLCDISKIMTIINGVDCDKFNIKAQQDVLKFRRLYGIPENAFVIGSVGRLAKIKNFSFLLNIIRECQDLFLVLVGDGPERTSLLQKVNEMSLANRCLFLGELKDISKVLSTFDVFANTSLYEGISNTILEAMASGIPVVANNVGGTPEIVSNGTTGFLIDANSKDKFINIFMKLKNNEALRQNVGVNSRKIVEGKYSLQSMVAKYQHIYNSLI